MTRSKKGTFGRTGLKLSGIGARECMVRSRSTEVPLLRENRSQRKRNDRKFRSSETRRLRE
jgi:hypothetical protein